MDHAARRVRLASRLPELEADAFLITRLPNVRYLTGFSGSNGQVILTPEDGVFLTDGRYAQQSRREVPDLRRVTYRAEFAPRFAEACRGLGAGRVAFESAGVTHRTYTQLVEAGIGLIPTVEEVERLRRIKDPEERAALEEAQAIADQAFDRITGKLSEAVGEREVALDLDVTMRGLGSEAVAFDTIVAFGESAAEPHHRPTERPLSRGEVVKMDFGCVIDGYHSDMTRTVAFGELDGQLREIYDVVRRAQQAGVDAVRPGVSCEEVDAATRDPIKEAGYGDQYGHGAGHGVGLEIHEAPWLRPGGDDSLLEGTVVTVEPGIYLEGRGGVRIEDMVEVTAERGRVLARTTKDLVIL
ncbi:MAG TPA: aminopeptidase P family protein [Actinomycetota bacterium]